MDWEHWVGTGEGIIRVAEQENSRKHFQMLQEFNLEFHFTGQAVKKDQGWMIRQEFKVACQMKCPATANELLVT